MNPIQTPSLNSGIPNPNGSGNLPTVNTNANYFQPGQGGNPTPPSNPINGSTLGQSTAMNLTTPTQPSVPNISMLGQSPTPQTPQTPTASTPSNSQTLLDRVTGLFGQSKNKETDLASATESATAPYQSQLNELNQQIKMQQAQAIQNADSATNRVGGTTGSNSIATQQQQRTDAIEALKLSALAEGMQGNIALAQQHATTAINAKYADINSQIEDAKTNIYKNYDTFTASEKKKADATLLRLDANDAFAKRQMEDEKTSSGIIQTAITQGATNGTPVPNVILAQAQKLTDPTQVTSLLAPYLKNAAEIQKSIDQHNESLASQGLTRANTVKASTASSVATNGGVTQELQNAINNGTIDPNRINSRTLGIYNAIAQAGTDAVGAHAGAAGETKAVTDLATYKSTATRTLGILDKNLPLVSALADKVNQTGIPGLDDILRGAKSYTGNNPDVIKYVNSIKTLRSEYAQMLAKGSVATEGDKRDAEQAIPSGLSSAGYNALGQQLKLEANNIISASNDAISAAKNKSASNVGSKQTVIPASQIPSGFYQASDGLLYKK